MNEILDDLAAFLMHRTVDPETSESDRMAIFVLVGAYQEGDNPPLVAAALRLEAATFAAHPDYRAEWAVTVDEDSIALTGQVNELLRGKSSGDDLLVRLASVQRRDQLRGQPGEGQV